MSTRKLILLALACGLAILIAGSIQILRIKDNEISTLVEGDSTEVATVTASVLSSSADEEGVEVVVRLAQRADAEQAITDASLGWQMLVSGESTFVEPVAPTASTQQSCIGLPVAQGGSVECAMRFARQKAAATVVRYRFGGAEASWSLAV